MIKVDFVRHAQPELDIDRFYGSSYKRMCWMKGTSM